MNTMEELPTRSKDRIAELKEAYIDDEISEQTSQNLFIPVVRIY
jgi:hypothetical protein